MLLQSSCLDAVFSIGKHRNNTHAAAVTKRCQQPLRITCISATLLGLKNLTYVKRQLSEYLHSLIDLS